MGAKETQAEIRDILVTMFDPDLVKSEWSVQTEATGDVYDRLSCAPRLDLAVGPFNLTNGRRNDDLVRIAEYQRHPLIGRLKNEILQQNHGGFYFNRNPRCLLAIELELSTSSKHILGGITNASMLGFIGVVVGSERYIAKIQRIYEYACRLREVESRLRKFEQDDKWSFCLTAGTLSLRIRRDHEQTTAPEPHPGLQGEGGARRRQG